MSESFPRIYLCRHGETAWNVTGQHTGSTDLPLTERGEEQARGLASRLAGLTIVQAFTSPLQRARRTCELAGFGEQAIVDPDLVEWCYGSYEGRRRAEILQERPDWNLFRDGCPGGETLADVAGRADRFIERLKALQADALVFSSGHFLRVLAVRWCGLDAAAARAMTLNNAGVSILGYEHGMDEPIIRMWNAT